MALIIDTSTGTVLTAHTCVWLEDDDLTQAEWDELDDYSDSAISDIGRQRGRPLIQSEQLLRDIAFAISTQRPDLFQQPPARK